MKNEKHGCKTDILAQTILVCKRWIANHLDAENWLKDREQELIDLFRDFRAENSLTLESDLSEKILNAKATFRLARSQQSEAAKLMGLHELETVLEDIETIKSEQDAGIEPDPEKVLLLENKLNKSRASLDRVIDRIDKMQLTFFRGEVLHEWLVDQVEQRDHITGEALDNLRILQAKVASMQSEAESSLWQFAMHGAAIDHEIEQLVPSLTQYHQELVYAWMKSKWEVREANWGTLYGKLKAAPNEQSLTEHYVEIAKSEAAKLIQISSKTLRRRMLDGTYDARELNKNVIRINKRHLPS